MQHSLGAVARIDTGALAHNLARVRALAPRSRVLAVVKADAYGHGLLTVARALADADGFAVARLAEAEQLRAAGITRRILLLPGVDTVADLGFAARLRVDVAVHHASQIDLLEQSARDLRINTWLKVDTGMHRLGISPGDAAEAYRRLSRCPCLDEPVRVMTHLADADETDKLTTANQIRQIRSCTADLAAEISVGNSAGILAWPEARSDWVRPGIMLYGVSPFAGETGEAHQLRPVMTLCSRLLSVKHVPRGGAIGYGGTFVAGHDMTVGAAAAGYADGYPRHAPSGTPVLVDGTRVSLVGRVSMDTVTLDLEARPDAANGATVTLWGKGLPVEEVAHAAGTIGYELLCRVGARVPRIPG